MNPGTDVQYKALLNKVVTCFPELDKGEEEYLGSVIMLELTFSKYFLADFETRGSIDPTFLSFIDSFFAGPDSSITDPECLFLSELAVDLTETEYTALKGPLLEQLSPAAAAWLMDGMGLWIESNRNIAKD